VAFWFEACRRSRDRQVVFYRFKTLGKGAVTLELDNSGAFLQGIGNALWSSRNALDHPTPRGSDFARHHCHRVATCSAAFAQKKYDTGASDTEIKIGNIVPYSGPASAYGTVGKAMAAVSWRLQLFSNDPTSPPQSPLDSILSRVKLSMGFVTAVSTE